MALSSAAEFSSEWDDLWFLPDQDSTHDLRNEKQMSNKTNYYWKDRPGRSLPPDTCKRNNRVDIHRNTAGPVASNHGNL